MRSLWRAIAHPISTAFRRRLSLQLEVDALRHQLSGYERSRPHRFRIEPGDRAFLDNHVKELVSIDFFVVPTLRFKILYVLVVLAHERRRIVHFNVTAHPTAQWTAQKMVEAFPFDTAPRYLIRDRDGIYCETFRRRVLSLSDLAVPTVPSPG